MLLLAFLPSIGRLASSHDAGPRTILMEMCTMGGETLVSMVDPFALLDTPEPAPAKHGDMPDCAYCPLLATTLVAMRWLAWSLVPMAALPVFARRPSRAAGRCPCGLGSRGPPFAA